MKTRSSAALLVAAGGLAITACAGPNAPFDVGTQNAPVGLTLGDHDAVVEAPVGPISTPLPPSIAPFVPVDELPSPTPEPSEGPKGPCPTANPLDPVNPGNLYLSGGPSPGTYTYRTTTTDTINGQVAKYKGPSTWTITVGKKDQVDGFYDMSIEVGIGKAKTTRVLRILPKSIPSPGIDSAPHLGGAIQTNLDSTLALLGIPPIIETPVDTFDVSRYGPAGIYLVSQTTGDDTFKPIQPMALLTSPAQEGTKFLSVGSDGKQVMKFMSTVTKRVAVDACGDKLEAFRVDLTEGLVAGLGDDAKVHVVNFTESIDFGMQFGGVPLQDTGKVKAVALPGAAVLPDQVERSFQFTINSTPKGPNTK